VLKAKVLSVRETILFFDILTDRRTPEAAVGRGLSNQQKKILGVAAERRLKRDFAQEERSRQELLESGILQVLAARFGGTVDESPYSYKDHADISHPELIAMLYDWPVIHREHWSDPEFLSQENLRPSEGGKVQSSRRNFRRSVVGEEEYNRRTASYYRSVTRLKERGLLEHHKHGVLITDEGIKAAQKLSVSNE
jgi:hypothetical protein